MRSRIGVLTVVAALGAGGCGGGSERSDLSDYLTDANEIQTSSSGLEEATKVFARFAAGEIKPKAAAEKVAGAEKAILEVRDELEGLDPPDAGERLHELLLKLYDLNAKLARETVLFAEFVPASDATAAGLDGANERMRKGLGRTSAPGAQARALDEYAADLGKVSDRLDDLDPPPILERAHRDRIERLKRIEEVATKLAVALRDGDEGSVRSLLTEFQQATGSGPTAGVDDQSVRKYRRRYARIRRVAADLRRQEQRTRRRLAE